MVDFPPKKPEKLDSAPVPEADAELDNAITDISRNDSDTELEAAFAVPNVSEKRSLKQKYLDHKKWTIPVTALLVILIVVFALPVTRYKILGIFISQPVAVTFQDQETHNPISNAVVHLGNLTATTNSSGKAQFVNVKLGSQKMTVSKQYYKTFSTTVFVGLSAPKPHTEELTATGRQITIHVTNIITNQPIAEAGISVLGTSAKTDSTGTAHLVLPADQASATTTITAATYNPGNGKVQITSPTQGGDTFQLVPAGRVYFLSNRSGKVDVVSTNYDGSDRQTIAAGTGYEDASSTQLFPSPDGKFVALFAKRSSSDASAGLYIIDTSSGKVSQAEAGASNTSILQVGWSSDYFVYNIENYTTTNQSTIKSYNALTSTSVTLDQTQSEGSPGAMNIQYFSNVITLMDNTVVYGTYWTTNIQGQIDSKSDTIVAVQPNGSNKKVLRSLTVPAGATYATLSQVQTTPEVSYFEFPTTTLDASNGAIFFKYTKGTITETNSFTYANFNDPNIASGYVSLSPSLSTSLFQDTIDGHLVVSTGDASGNGKQKVIQLPSAGHVIGWLDDSYVLVSQSPSQLYVVPSTASATAKPLLVSDYLASQHGN